MDNPVFEPAIMTTTESDKNEIHDVTSNASIPTTPLNVADDNQQQTKVFVPKIEMPSDVTPPPVSTPKIEPVSKMIDQILRDPATLKLLTLIVSVFALYLVFPRIRDNSSQYFIIYCSSLIYSVFAIFVTVVWKSQENIGKNGILKKCFSGRNIYWHEFHSTMTLLLALSNFSCIVFDTNRSDLNYFCSLTNAMAFGYEFFVAHKTSKLFVVEENIPKSSWKLTKCILGAIKRHPIKFNVLQFACCIAAFGFYQYQARTSRSYFIYSSLATIFGSSLPLLFRLTKRCKCRCGNWYFSNPKNQTYLTIGVFLHAFFAVFTNSFDTQYTEYYDPSDLDYYGNASFHYISASFVTFAPISFAFSCIVFLLSIFDLHSQAIFNKSRPVTEATKNSLIIETNQKSFQNLPTVIENPFGIEGNKKVYEY